MSKTPHARAWMVAALFCAWLSSDGQAVGAENSDAHLSAIEPLAADEVIGILSAPHLSGVQDAEDPGRCVARELARMAPAIACTFSGRA